LCFTGVGDVAMLIQSPKINFAIDTSLPQAARLGLDWNSKKAGELQKPFHLAVK